MLTCSLCRDLHTWSSCWNFLGGVVGLERSSRTFLPYIETRWRSHRRDSDTQICTTRQVCRKTVRSMEVLVGKCSLYLNYLVWEWHSHTSFLARNPWPPSNCTCIMLFLAFVHCQQNRRRKV